MAFHQSSIDIHVCGLRHSQYYCGKGRTYTGIWNIAKSLETNNSRTNPMIVELNGKKVYGKSSMLPIYILIIAGTIGLSVYNLYQVLENN